MTRGWGVRCQKGESEREEGRRKGREGKKER